MEPRSRFAAGVSSPIAAPTSQVRPCTSSPRVSARPANSGAIEREIAVAGHVIEKSGVHEFRPVEAGYSLKLGAGEAGHAGETTLIEAGIAEESDGREIHRR